MFKTFACVALLLFSNMLHAGTATVAAAATLRYALNEIAPEFKKASGHELKVAYGSSGNLMYFCQPIWIFRKSWFMKKKPSRP
jgi:molybdate transport system substrate-binding protein